MQGTEKQQRDLPEHTDVSSSASARAISPVLRRILDELDTTGQSEEKPGFDNRL